MSNIPPIGWVYATQLCRLYRRDGLSLLVGVTTIDGSSYSCYALETAGEDARSIFDKHAHVIIGTRKDLTKAIVLCEDYAKKWKRKKRTAKQCECDTVAAR